MLLVSWPFDGNLWDGSVHVLFQNCLRKFVLVGLLLHLFSDLFKIRMLGGHRMHS